MHLYTFMTHSHLEFALNEINLAIHVETQLGQTIYASQCFQMQGTQFWTQNSLNPL